MSKDKTLINLKKIMISENIMKNLYESANTIRKDVLEMLKNAGSGHLGGSYSEAEILSVLFHDELNLRPEEPNWDERDRFILSKGHSCPGLYSILAQKGFFPKEELKKLRQLDSLLQGHPERITPGVEYIAGFLGQGLSAGCGMALGFKKEDKENRVYVLIGDGDNLEGQTWEAARFAVHNGLDNLVAIYDYNNLLSDDNTDNILSIINPEKQWSAFGWNVISVDGHNVVQLIKALKIARETKGIPTIIICETKKGHGVSIWEDTGRSHGSWGPTPEEYSLAMKELKMSEEKIQRLEFPKDELIQTVLPQIKIQKEKNSNFVKDFNTDFSEYLFKNDQLISLRNAFGMACSNLGKLYDNFDLFDADVKGGTMAKIFEENFPNRFIQCGIAEQNMISAAAGYHLSTGRLPIITTYAVFTSMLAAAQFRNGVALQKLPYIVASSHVGLDTGPDGPTHQAIEDLGIFSTYPGVQVLSPSDPNILQSCLESAILSKKPTYMRTGRSPVPVIHPENMKYQIGHDTIIKEGTDITVFSTGIMVHRVIEAEKHLSKEGIKIEIVDITSINPLDDKTILKSVKKTGCAITVEDHYVKNGLGSAINQLICNNYPIPIKNIGIKEYAESASPSELASKYQIDFVSIIKKVKEMIRNK